MKLALPTFHVFSPFSDPYDRLPNPDEWQLVIACGPISGLLALCYWVCRGIDSLFCAAQLSHEDWETDVANIMDRDGPVPEQLADDLVHRLYAEAIDLPPPGSTPSFVRT